jgi:lipid-A-disaccharide synthase-like uncharacterized protein
MKPGPIIAMLLILGLSLWFMRATDKAAPATPGAAQIELVVANKKLKVEQRPVAGSPDQYEFRFRNLEGQRPDWVDQATYHSLVMKNADLTERSWILRWCNVSNYANLAWVALGFGGQFIFAGRMVVQWLASEKRRQSVVPAAFWYMSLGGGLLLTAYFVWRHDPVGVLGQAMGLVVYVRNIRLLMLHRPSLPRGSAAPATAG